MGKVLKLVFKDGSTQLIRMDDVLEMSTIEDTTPSIEKSDSNNKSYYSVSLIGSTICPEYVGKILLDSANIKTIGNLVHHTDYQLSFILKRKYQVYKKLIASMKKNNINFEPITDLRSTPIEAIEFINNSSALGYLLKAGISRVSDIVSKTPTELCSISGVGRKTYILMVNWLTDHGLTLVREIE